MTGESVLNIETLREQIPYYLTEDQRTGLTKALNDFPDNINYYLSNCPELQGCLLQGDILSSLPIFSEHGKKEVTGIILSNSCDIDDSNKRDLPARALFAPLISLERFEGLLQQAGKNQKAITEKVNAIREQRITNIVYLPAPMAGGMEESIVFLDDMHRINAKSLNDKLTKSGKQFTLSQVGFYILLFKLSLHFCRFHEDVARFDEKA